MRSPRMKALLWQGAGWLCYLLGLLVFLLTAVGIWLGDPSGSFENAGTADFVLLAGGLVLIVVGRVVSIKLGNEMDLTGGAMGPIGDQGPEQSRLEELGYHIPPESNGDASGTLPFEDGTVTVVCDECGERNDESFDYCRQCSAKLPR